MGNFSTPPSLNLLPPPSISSFSLDSKISSSIILILIILAIIFFISALLHLLLRCFFKPTQRDPDEPADVTALQGQLRQLFHLHDAGVDQLYIDTLPVFPYKAIVGVKDPFDCAVCLCEFEPHDKLRLLPKCSHAFHMDCIDTWLLSHSTCPLCRSSLLPGSNEDNGYRDRVPIPIVCVLESGSIENSREIRESISLDSRIEFGSSHFELVGRKSCESWGKEEEEKSVIVKLGKFRNTDGDNIGSSEINSNNDINEKNDSFSNNEINNDLTSRRCYSMGSFAYILDEKASLQVTMKTFMKKKKSKKPGHRTAMSEYGYDNMKEFNVNVNERNKRESFSVSKIWQRGGERNKKLENDHCNSRRTISEIEIEDGELKEDHDETQSCYSVDSLANSNVVASSSHRRTLLWLMGRNNKIVHNHSSSISSNV